MIQIRFGRSAATPGTAPVVQSTARISNGNRKWVIGYSPVRLTFKIVTNVVKLERLSRSLTLRVESDRIRLDSESQATECSYAVLDD